MAGEITHVDLEAVAFLVRADEQYEPEVLLADLETRMENGELTDFEVRLFLTDLFSRSNR